MKLFNKRRSMPVLLLALIVTLSLSLILVACGGGTESAEEPSEGTVAGGRMLTLKSGAPDVGFGNEGDVCLVAESGVLYRKTAQGWSAAEYDSYGADGDVFTVTYSDGLVGTYEMDHGDVGEHAHTLGEMYTVYPAQCVVPGIGVRTCTVCGESFPEIIPASGHHHYTLENVCSDCGGKWEYTEGLDFYLASDYGSDDIYAVFSGIGDVVTDEIVIPYGYTNRLGEIYPVKGIQLLSGDSAELRRIVMPDSVEWIESSAFRSCKKLEEVVFSDSLQRIGENAFNGVTSLKGDLVLPDSLTEIGDGAFAGCTGFDGKLVLPDSLTTIGDGAFAGCTGFEGELVIPDSVVNIGKVRKAGSGYVSASGAFRGCTGFTSLDLPQNGALEGIGGSAFYGCSGFTGELKIPDTVKKIGRGAFYGCSGFTGTLRLPDSLEEDGLGVGKHSNESVNYNSIHVTWSGNYPIFKTEGTFRECTGIERLEIGSSALREIGWTDFYGCTSLKEIVFSDSIEKVDKFAFDSCTALETITFSESGALKEIGEYAFYQCEGLELLSLPEGLVTLQEAAFMGCYSLKGTSDGTLILPDSLEAIGVNCFELDNIVWISLDDALEAGGYITAVEFGDSLEELTNNIFGDRMAISSISFGSGLKKIGSSVFTRLNIETVSFAEGCMLQEIGDSAFYECAKLAALELPGSLVSIGNRAFERCTNLSSLILPDSLVSIGEYAFYRCTGLEEELVIPKSVESIGADAFFNIHVTSLKFEKDAALKTIGDSAFYALRHISELVIPENVTSIGSGAFSLCDLLWEVWNYSQLSLTPESNCWSSVKKVHAPDEPSSFITDGDYSWFDCGDEGYCYLLGYTGTASDLTLPAATPSGIRYHIYQGAFKGCESLEKVTIGRGVQTIGQGVKTDDSEKGPFYGCTNLTELTIEEGVELIGGYAFANTSIETIRFLGSVDAWNTLRYASNGKSGYWSAGIDELQVECNNGIGETTILV